MKKTIVYIFMLTVFFCPLKARLKARSDNFLSHITHTKDQFLLYSTAASAGLFFTSAGALGFYKTYKYINKDQSDAKQDSKMEKLEVTTMGCFALTSVLGTFYVVNQSEFLFGLLSLATISSLLEHAHSRVFRGY